MASNLKNWAVVALAGVALAAIGVFVTPGVAHAGNYRKLMNVSNFHCLDIYEDSKANGELLIHSACNNDEPQIWNLTFRPGKNDGKYWIQSAYSGKCVQADYDDYRPTYQNECNVNTVRQLWRFVRWYDGYSNHYLIKNDHTGRCLYPEDAVFIGTVSCNTVYDHYVWATIAL